MAKQAREVVIHVRLALTIQVETQTADEAEDQANAIADAWVSTHAMLSPPYGVEELDRLVNRVRRVGERPARTVMVGRHIGGGVYNDEGADL